MCSEAWLRESLQAAPRQRFTGEQHLAVAMKNAIANEPRQPTPVERQACIWTPLARRGCAPAVNLTGRLTPLSQTSPFRFPMNSLRTRSASARNMRRVTFPRTSRVFARVQYMDVVCQASCDRFEQFEIRLAEAEGFFKVKTACHDFSFFYFRFGCGVPAGWR